MTCRIDKLEARPKGCHFNLHRIRAVLGHGNGSDIGPASAAAMVDREIVDVGVSRTCKETKGSKQDKVDPARHYHWPKYWHFDSQ